MAHLPPIEDHPPPKTHISFSRTQDAQFPPKNPSPPHGPPPHQDAALLLLKTTSSSSCCTPPAEVNSLLKLISTNSSSSLLLRRPIPSHRLHRRRLVVVQCVKRRHITSSLLHYLDSKRPSPSQSIPPLPHLCQKVDFQKSSSPPRHLSASPLPNYVEKSEIKIKIQQKKAQLMPL